MIITVTMNPALDKTVDLSEFEYGGLNRIEKVVVDVGGKGINVSKTIKALGGDSIATGFIGGSCGNLIQETLTESGIETDFVQVNTETRTNLKIVEKTGAVTELNEPGPYVTPQNIESLMNKLEGYANSDAIFVLAGSIPQGVEKDIYGVITKKVHSKGAKVILDADGELFFNSLEARPDVVKPNRVELEELFGMDYRATEGDLIRMGEELLGKNIDMVTISLGKMGALFLSQEKKIKCPGLSVKSHSTVGAGDAMVAALAYSLNQKLPMKEYVPLSIAVSAGAVTTIGTKPPTRRVVDELIQQVEMIEL